MRCALCDVPIADDELRRAWREAAGYVKPRGAQSMVGRKYTGRAAHEVCVTRLRAKVEPMQEAMPI